MTALAPCEYRTGKTLGSGSYASVKESVHVKTGERFAVKVISKKLMRGREHMILNEIDVLKRVSKGHANIVTLHDYFETPNNLYLVMDLCTGGELFDRIVELGSFYESDAVDTVRTIVDAVSYLHDQNIVHRDLKPENLLYKGKDEGLVIADFGLSKIIDSDTLDSLKTTCGTPGYMAPEVITKAGHGKAVDMWSVGVLTYFMLCGYMPFDAESRADELQNILSAKFTFEPSEYWFEVSDEAKDFINKLLVVDPSQRMSAKAALEHPWLKKLERKRTVELSQRLVNAKKTFKMAVNAVIATRRLSITLKNQALPIKVFTDAELEELKPAEDATTPEGSVLVLPKEIAE